MQSKLVWAGICATTTATRSQTLMLKESYMPRHVLLLRLYISWLKKQNKCTYCQTTLRSCLMLMRGKIQDFYNWVSVSSLDVKDALWRVCYNNALYFLFRSAAFYQDVVVTKIVQFTRLEHVEHLLEMEHELGFKSCRILVF